MRDTAIRTHSQVIKTWSVNTARIPALAELTENTDIECTLLLNPQHKDKAESSA